MKATVIALLLAVFAFFSSAQNNPFASANDVTWNSLGTNENDSMPLGNGDIVLLPAKSDAWSENGQLLKLGRVRLRLEPNPFTRQGVFTQTLRLAAGDVQILNGGNMARNWVDANSTPLTKPRWKLILGTERSRD